MIVVAATSPVVITVAGVAAIAAVGYIIYATKADIDQFNEAVRRYERECGKTLDRDQRQRLHRAISGKGYGIPDIVEDAKAIFGCPNQESKK